MEGGPIVISATDDDIYEPFKTVSFKLLNSVDDPVTQFFKIDPNSGALTLKEAIENFELDGSQDTINVGPFFVHGFLLVRDAFVSHKLNIILVLSWRSGLMTMQEMRTTNRSPK